MWDHSSGKFRDEPAFVGLIPIGSLGDSSSEEHMGVFGVSLAGSLLPKFSLRLSRNGVSTAQVSTKLGIFDALSCQ